ncbi:Lar family restriction alleviation protein [Thiolapillus brandeum]|uniref:Restriction alleviation protein, Lar family n=1 Tax=Thiolapillus brandeum TaxID=1076588 RepID=A0A7U6GHU3_9GAMM|nr:Lar family restriction alleviation protein [Thiolapillus brandeum]BAO43901.1 hypothetical protein TBH_C0971 [Thiolapillus brandeum]
MIEPMTERELSPCPFCGQQGIVILVEAEPEWLHVFAHCHNCGARGGETPIQMGGVQPEASHHLVAELESATEVAVDDWNMRPKEQGK